MEDYVTDGQFIQNNLKQGYLATFFFDGAITYADIIDTLIKGRNEPGRS